MFFFFKACRGCTYSGSVTSQSILEMVKKNLGGAILSFHTDAWHRHLHVKCKKKLSRVVNTARRKSQGKHGCNYAAGMYWIPKKKPLDITSKWTWTSIHIALFWSTDCSERFTMHATFTHSHAHIHAVMAEAAMQGTDLLIRSDAAPFIPSPPLYFYTQPFAHTHWWKSHREQFGCSVSLAQEHLDMWLEPGSITTDLLISRPPSLPSAKSHQETIPRNHVS